MPRRLVGAVALLLLAMACGRDPPACTVEGIHAMRRQPKYIPYDPSAFFTDGRAMRLPPEGVVERRSAEPFEVRTGIDGSGDYVRRLPLPLTAALLQEGEGHFRAVCAACHGVLGDGRSVVATKMALRPPPDLKLHRVDLGGHAAAPAPPPGPAPGGEAGAGAAGGIPGSLFPDVPPPAIELGNPLPTRDARTPVPAGGWTHPPGYVFAVITRGYGLMPSFAAALTPRQRWAVVAHLAALQLSQRAPVGRLSAAQRRQLREGRPHPAATSTPAVSNAHRRVPAARLGALLAVSAALLVAGLVATAFWPSALLPWYLAWFIVIASVPAGALVWVLQFHASNAAFAVVVRRPLETVAAAAALLWPLFIPVAVGAPHLFPWPTPATLEATDRAAVVHQAIYLNRPFFLLRAMLYLAFWTVVAELLLQRSRQQDTGPDLDAVARSRGLASAALPAYGILTTFAAVDWIMSRTPRWQSTLFGLYVVGGFLVAGISVAILATRFAERRGWLAGLVNRHHYHSLGNYLFATVCVWGYLAFSQFMLIWIGNLPDEIRWYLPRVRGAWGVVALVLVAGHFVLPFLALLFRRLKQSPSALAGVAGWLLAFHALDIIWTVIPGSPVESPLVALLSAPSLIGSAGLLAAFVRWRLAGHPAVSPGDPDLDMSRSYCPRQ
jgi:hypothetical protein